ncbi:MAG TPA: HAMP domain-containing sensor histidine kinase [Thermoanaerobaculia bacterium]|nr:HAMP domain-containing sensor histidine kinase [Thermoanaerobaculia bacterium]
MAAPAETSILSGLTHELRTPLNSILMLSELLEESLAEGAAAGSGPGREPGQGQPPAGGKAEREARYARNIRQAAEDLLELVNQAGELGRVESGRFPLEARPFATADLARRLAESWREAAGAPEAVAHGGSTGAAHGGKARLAVERTASAPETVVTDPAKLLRAAELVVSGALHASQGGAVAVALEAASGGGLAIRVADSGPPLSPAEAEALFVPFGGAGPRTARRFGGTGLGLSVAHGLARLLGGELTAEPGPAGQGCAFVLSIPASR